MVGAVGIGTVVTVALAVYRTSLSHMATMVQVPGVAEAVKLPEASTMPAVAGRTA